MLSKIISQLREIKDNNDVRPLYLVDKKENLFYGSYIEKIPDIILLPNEGYVINIDVFQNKLFSLYNPYLEGYHGHGQSLFGTFIAMGDDIKQVDKELKDLNILDITPTTLTIMGFEVNNLFDGKVLFNIFNKKINKHNLIHLKKKELEKEFIQNSIKELDLIYLFVCIVYLSR